MSQRKRRLENREALLRAASKLFREKGIDGVGVADVAREAGLTHGALYAHFSSKDALAAAAFSEGFAGNMAAMRAWAGDRSPSFADYVAALMSERMRDRLATGCPMAASASEAGRQGEAFSESFARPSRRRSQWLKPHSIGPYSIRTGDRWPSQRSLHI